VNAVVGPQINFYLTEEKITLRGKKGVIFPGNASKIVFKIPEREGKKGKNYQTSGLGRH